MNAIRLILVCCLVGVAGGCGSSAPDAPDASERPERDGGGEDEHDGGVCGFESFGHPLGYPCNAHRDCESGQCTASGNESYCTRACDPGQMGSCPDGMACQTLGSNGALARCVISDSATTLPRDGSLHPGAPCNVTKDCASDSVCGAVQESDSSYYTFCAPPCQVDADCNGCGTCQPFGSGQQYCMPKGLNAVGEACETRHQCESFLCLEFCTQACGRSGDAPCPGNSTCEVADGATNLCVLPSQKETAAEGQACRFQFECAAGSQCLLNDEGLETVCTAPRTAGTPCRGNEQCASGLSCRADETVGLSVCKAPGPVGARCESDAQCLGALGCRSFATGYSLCSEPCREDAECGAANACVAIDVNTTLSLYAGVGATAALASNDDIDAAAGNVWSRIRFTAQPGTYSVRVGASNAFRGRYTLEILDGVNAPTALSETGGELNAFPNGTLADAQVLDAFPAVVTGIVFDTNDVDFYRFTIPGPEPIDLVVQTGPGAPSACLPSARAESISMGDTCRFNQECASGVCERQLGVCGAVCDVDSPCAEGFACVPLTSANASHLTCVTNARVGVVATGNACAFHHECADAYCATFRGQRLCAPRCDADAASCTAGLECALLDVFEGGESAQHHACVPEGSADTTFNGACILQSDCAPDLVCDEGVCRSMCETTDECPAGATPPEDDEFTCKPCKTFTNCGADFKGECWNDSFCVRPCTDAPCPAGFSCQTNDWGDYCVPSAGGCYAASCRVEPEAEAGLCVVPFAGLANACGSSFDCLSGTCSDGLCSTTCETDADCGCDNSDFVCTDAQCRRAAGVTEAEPNDDASSAQALSGNLPLRVYGSIRHPGEVDFFKVTLPADSVVNVAVHKLCLLNPYSLDTRLFIIKNGSVLAQDSPYSYLGRIDAFVASGGEYFIKVEDEPHHSGSNSEYVLTVEAYKAP